MKEIILSNGDVSYVDDCDYEKVRKFKWRPSKNGKYARTDILKDGKWRCVLMHRLIMDIIENKDVIYDHIDRNGLNNTRNNLRIATKSDNTKNRSKHRGTSKYTGVSWHRNKWIAHININGRTKHLGLFINEMDAAKAYNEAAILTGNCFYNLNTI